MGSVSNHYYELTIIQTCICRRVNVGDNEAPVANCSDLKVPELKAILRKRGISSIGYKKAESVCPFVHL